MNFVRRTLTGVYSLLVAAALFATANSHANEQAPIIAVASNLRLTIEEIAQSFHKDTGLGVRFAFGSSGNLTRQILQGAPFEMFMSADEGYVFRISDADRSIDRGKIYAFGRIVAFTPRNSPLQAAGFPEGYSSIFETQNPMRYAIANPELAPYGRAAREALMHAGLWEMIQPRLIFGENISQTAQFTLSGSTMGGIIAYSQALAPQFMSGGKYILIPSAFHQPLGQRMVLLKNSGEPAKRFYEYLGRETARKIFRKNGYALESGEG